MYINFHDQTNTITEDHISLLNKMITYAAEKENVPREAEMSINFADNEEIQRLNRNYRQIDRPTDVISFALQDEVEGEIDIIGEGIPLALGDIVISVDKVKDQAKEYEHSFERELSFLAVHGFLHLLGYDHSRPEEEKEMFQKQEQLLGEFGLGR